MGEKADKKFIDFIIDNDEEAAMDVFDMVKDINCTDDKSRSALQLACNRNMIDLAALLINRGAHIDSRDQWKVTPLMRASYNKNHRIMSLLIERGAAVNAKNIYGKSVVLYAADGGSTKTLEVLLEKGASIDDTDDVQTTCLHYASGKDPEDPKMIQFILDTCGNMHQKDINNKNALDYALERGLKKTVKLLKTAGLTVTPEDEIIEEALKQKKKLIKTSVCHNCGASKETVTKTAWIYCDFCASCIDWDYNKAIETEVDPSIQQAYSENYYDRMAGIEKAAKNDNYEKVKKLVTQNAELEMAAYPNYHPPRVINEQYKKQYLEYLAQFKKVLLDKDLKNLIKKQEKLNSDMIWNGETADHVSFMNLLDVFIQYQKCVADKVVESGVLRLHPDNVNRGLVTKMICSTFLQAWIPYLESEDAEKAVEKCGLQSEYHAYAPQNLHEKKCGQCGTELKVVQNSKKVLCDSCGYIIDVESDEFACVNCAALLSLQVDVRTINCPFCGTSFGKTS